MPDGSLNESLEKLFGGSGISWQRRGSNVILKPAPLLQRERRRTITVSGYITDAASSETLIGAGVLAGKEGKSAGGSVTNEFGFYTLSLAPGRYSIVASHLGYDRQTMEVNLVRDTTFNFSLTSNSELDAARVVSRKDAGIQSVYGGSLEIPVHQIQSMPVLFGESDVIKAIQMLPGVQGGVEGFSGLHVRGGGPDENLILLDGIPVYYMDHMLGLFSIFQTEAIKDVTLYKGTFPARYGGRISSILDIRTVDGNMKETHGSFTIGLLNDKFHLEGPIIKDKLSYSVSARALHTLFLEPFIDAVLPLASNDIKRLNYFFYDFHGKVNWKIGDRDRLYFGVYHGADDAGYERKGTVRDETASGVSVIVPYKGSFGLDWGSTMGSVRWNHVFGGDLFSNTTAWVNRYGMKMYNKYFTYPKVDWKKVTRGYELSYSSGIFDSGIRFDADWRPVPGHAIKMGAEDLFHIFRPEAVSTIYTGVPNENGEYATGPLRYYGNEFSVFAEDNMEPLDWLTVNPGLYLTWFCADGANYVYPQPRLAAKADVGKGLMFKAGYARMAQYVHLLSSTAIPLPLDVWMPVTKTIKPVTSDQFSAGVYYDGIKGWEFSVEGYLKYMDNLLEYKEGILLIGDSRGWDDKVIMGKGKARGLEFMARKTSGKTTGWVSYTLAKSEREFDNVNAGKPFPYKYDRRHCVDIVVNHKFSEKIDISASWMFASGGWMTVPTRASRIVYPDRLGASSTYAFTAPIGYVSGRNNYNLPPTHRLNVGVNFRKITPKGNESVWNLSLYNAYNAMNPNFVYYDIDTGGETGYIKLTKLTLLPILPAVSYSLKF